MSDYADFQISHAEIILVAQKNTEDGDRIVAEFLDDLAGSFDAKEIFEMIAYVDTPDVLG